MANRKYNPIPRLSAEELTRFHARVHKKSNEECWPWLGIKSSQGYGFIKIRRRMFSTHRVAYAADKRDPGQMLVCHRCDNPSCCNPSHLFLGTNRDNQIDARDKGRLHPVRGDEHHMRRNPEKLRGRKTDPSKIRRGEQTGVNKLTADQVRELRRMYAEGYDTMVEIAAYYGIHAATVCDIINRKRWRHVD